VGKEDGVAGGELGGDGVEFGGADELAEIVDGGLGNDGPVVAEMNNMADAAGGLDLAEAGIPVEAGEEITGKERFGDPGGGLSGGALEADAGEKYFNVVHFSKMGCREVLVLGVGLKTKPAHGFVLRRNSTTG